MSTTLLPDRVNKSAKSYIGERFGRLVVQAVAPKRRSRQFRLCRCDCGTLREFRLDGLLADVRSCGCLQRAANISRLTTHGLSGSAEHDIWMAMTARCKNERDSHYADYGGRGISVCERWRRSFEAFIADMGRRPSPKYSLDRINNDGNYESGNCRWATQSQQGRNTRRNRLVTFRGKTQCLQAWVDETGITYKALAHRLNRGWSVERALTTPTQAREGK